MAEAISIPSPSVFLSSSSSSSKPEPPNPDGSATASRNNTPKNARRASPSQETKKKAARKSVGPLNGIDGSSVVKPKQSKSRNGCTTCKAKRLKCDEEKPRCQQCIRRGVDCGGYKKDFKWRPFEETTVKFNIERQKRGNSPKQNSNDFSGRTTPTTINKPTNTVDAASKDKQDILDKDGDSPIEDEPPPAPVALDRLLPERPKPTPRADSGPVSPDDEISDPMSSSLINDMLPPVSIASFEPNPTDFYPGALSHLTPGLGLSPSLTDALWPFNADDPMHQDFVTFELPEIYQSLNDDPILSPPDLDENITEDEIEFMARNTTIFNDITLPVSAGLLTPLGSSSADSPEDSFRAPGYIYPQPLIKPNSGEMLTYRFDKVTCGILSIVDGEGENPWRKLIWGLAQESPALYHAISAMAAFHSAIDVPGFRVLGHEHKAASIRYIQEGIRDNSFSLQTAIATALALGLSEAWDQHTITGNTHIKGAQALVMRALQAHRMDPLEGEELARLKFLCNAWVYMDVIARLTSFDNDDMDDFDHQYIFKNNPNNNPKRPRRSSHSPRGTMSDNNADGFGIDFGMPLDHRLDPLMGCASTLFPLIGRVANLVRKVCRSKINSPAVIDQANDLKIALETWEAPQEIEEPLCANTSVQHTLQTAEAYRWATLLHLHQSVPELPSLTSTELAHRTLQYLATVPLTSGSCIVHVYPLMVAGCEAKTEEDRNWVRKRWDAMNQRMRLGLLEKAATVMEEVWRRRDVYEAQPTSNRKLVDTSDLRREKQRGRPFIRSPSGGMRLGDPGRSGIVFSYDMQEQEVQEESDGERKMHRARQRRNGKDPRMDLHDAAYTVRGHLHWVGVMWDWGWEVLLG